MTPLHEPSISVTMPAMSALQDVKPAGGAELGEVLVASALGAGLAAALLLVVYVHRSGRTTLVQRAADGVGRAMGAPGWVALPTVFTTVSLLTALTGMYWDISLHIGQGRDSGPLANPAHYLILFGLFGIFAGGTLAICLPVGVKPGPASVRITKDWHAPVGGLLLAGAGMYALIGFPLDDVWHRLFGQDVTLWGPTHLMLIGGAGLSLVGLLVLEKEGAQSKGDVDEVHGPVRDFVRKAFATGGLLIGLSVFQGEFDFGVPQFRLVLQPALIAGAAGLALVAARLWIGKGGALAAAAFFLFVHGAISIAVGFGWDEVTPRFPLYLGSAVLVEVVAAVLGTRRPLLFGVVGGAVVGTLGTGTEALWSQAFMPLPWGSDMAVEGTLMALVTGVAGGVIGVLLALGLEGRLPTLPRARLLYVASLAAVALVVANGLIATVPQSGDVDVALTEAGERGGVRYVDAEVTLPKGTVDDPSWVQVTAWQGDGLVLSELEQTTEGTWRSTEPFPVSGPDWKTLLRVHDGRALTALPIWLPADAAIDAEEVAAPARFSRPLGPEIEILQRERNLGVPGWLFGAGSLVVLVCTLVLVGALAWGVGRVSRGGPRPRGPRETRSPSRALKAQPAS
ncbi:MAG: conserved rane protein of unknown function [Frankiales bacterium]|nr:conserved rane protein of unknown function [Frankiales bacterium]